MGLGDFAAATASDFWSHPKVTKRWPGDGQAGLGLRPPPPTALPPDPTTGAQRPCAKPKPHNSETQAMTFSGCSHPNSYYSGPKARKEGQQNQGMGAGREAGFFVGRPLGAGAEAPEIFWVLLYLYKSTSPGGETSPSPSRPQAKSSEN